MRRTKLLQVAATVATVMLAGTIAHSPMAGADPNPPLKKGPGAPIKMKPLPPAKIKPLPPTKIKPLPPPKIKPLPPPKKPLPPPGKKPPGKGPGGGWHRPYVLPSVGFWLWQGTRYNSYDYEGCGYEYYKWKSTGSSYWRRMYRECRELD